MLGGNFLVGSRLLLEGETLNRWEIGLKKTERDYRVSATLFGRDYRFARTSPDRAANAQHHRPCLGARLQRA